jgi:hypothetical protein
MGQGITADQLAPGVQTIYSSKVVLINAQIKALPTTLVDLVAAQGSGIVTVPIYVIAVIDLVQPYTNVGAYPYSVFGLNGRGVSEDAYDCLTDAINAMLYFPPYARKSLASDNHITGSNLYKNDFINAPISIGLSNWNDAEFTDLGNLTGG